MAIKMFLEANPAISKLKEPLNIWNKNKLYLLDKIPSITNIINNKSPITRKYKHVKNININFQENYPQELLWCLEDVEVLSADDTGINHLVNFGSQLQKLIICRNKIHVINFNRFIYLSRLDISWNNLTEFVCPPNLKILIINDNQLKKIILNKGLYKLNISFNPIDEIDFLDNKYLQLNLYQTNISIVPKFATEINISFTKIKITDIFKIRNLKSLTAHGYDELPAKICLTGIITVKPKDIKIVHRCCSHLFPDRNNFYVSAYEFFKLDIVANFDLYRVAGFGENFEENMKLPNFPKYLKQRYTLQFK